MAKYNIYEDEEEYEKDAELDKFIGNVDTSKPGYHIPPPPQKGKFIKCQWCGKDILPSQLSRDKDIRKREVKWHIHEVCRRQTIKQLNDETPGYQAEKWRAEKRRRALENAAKPVTVERKKSYLELSMGGQSRGKTMGRGRR